MAPEDRQKLDSVIRGLLQEDEARLLIEQAKSKLIDDAERRTFNTERAIEVFQMAIERAIWKRFGSRGAATTRAVRGTGIIEAFAQRFTDEFKEWLGVSDQRPARRGLRAKFIGR